MTAEELIHEMPKGLIKWYPFIKDCNVLYITANQEEDNAFLEILAEQRIRTDCYTVDDLLHISESIKYDYAIILSAIERAGSMSSACNVLRKIYNRLNNNGVLLLGTDNRLGIRYFCGDRDRYTERNFDSIENYVRANGSEYDDLEGHSYAKSELIEMLEHAGFMNHRFYSVFPLLQRPQILFAEDYTPKEKLDIRIFPQYHSPDTVFLEEDRLYDTLIQNGLFHIMANGFLIECPLNGIYANAYQITVSMERGKNNAMFTIIRRDEKVEKKAVYEDGKAKAAKLIEHQLYLSEHNVSMVDAVLENDSYIMPYVHDISALEYLRNLIIKDSEVFFKRLDELWQIILSSSEHVPYSEIDWEKYEPYWEQRKEDDPAKKRWKKMAYGTQRDRECIGIILKRGYIDMVPLNCFWSNDKFVFYDQELYIENLPAKVILLRTIDLLYLNNIQLNNTLPIEEVKERYGLNECSELYYKFISKFLNNFRNDNILSFYYQKVRQDVSVLNANRQRMNYSAKEYERIFRDIFKGADHRKLYLFGSGNFTKQFLSQFSSDYKVTGIVDNNSAKWGTKINGVEIYPPYILEMLEKGTFKVIICIKNYLAVMKQLQAMGIMDFSIYDSSLTYPRKINVVPTSVDKNADIHKKYHVGYIAGVFDLFHIGHLNMFKRAKEQCDYLIVGVVTDEGVQNDKRTMPFIPFEERIEMVRSCQYVDEAVRIPPEKSNTEEAYRRYQFDVQFSGSDYANSATWLANKEFLRKQGADLIFFPYTQSTSSTKLKAIIEKRLEQKG